MKVGTKSVLFGAHCFFLHPWFVALAWWKLYGFPWDLRLWVAFFVHDLGYIGKPNMDGPEGETHPKLGARIMRWFDRKPYTWEHREIACWDGRWIVLNDDWRVEAYIPGTSVRLKRPRYRWSDFVLLHSRYYAKKLGLPFSQLCVADKLALALTPRWLYLPMVTATGELREYLKNAQRAESEHWKPTGFDAKKWHAELCVYMRKWVDEHKDGREDTWTSANRHAHMESGVWK